MKSALGENPKKTGSDKGVLPRTRMGVAAVIRTALIAAGEYGAKIAAHDVVARDLGKEALCRALAGELAWEQHVHRHDDIATALRLADEFGLRLVLNHGTEARKLAPELAARGVPVVFGPVLSTRGKVEAREAAVENVVALKRAGVDVAICTDHPVVPVDALMLQAVLAHRAGLDRAEAFATVTDAAARISGIDDVVGALAPGRDGDIVLWDGDPLDARSQVDAVFLRGVRVYDRRAGGIVAPRWGIA